MKNSKWALALITGAVFTLTGSIHTNPLDESYTEYDGEYAMSAVKAAKEKITAFSEMTEEAVVITALAAEESAAETSTVPVTTTSVTTTTTVTTTEAVETTTEEIIEVTVDEDISALYSDFVVTENPLVSNLSVSTMSVSCLKIEWDGEEGRGYQIDVYTYADYVENITFIEEENDFWYLTGLRENSWYEIYITPILWEGETEAEVSQIPASALCRTEAVEVIQEYETEEGWTNCFTGEKASGLTLMPSSGAIYGSAVDDITDTGIMRFENGDYCCAMGVWYGYCNDRFLVELENGIQFTTRICDSKGFADDGEGRYHLYGNGGKSVIEFIYDEDSLPSCVAVSGSWGYYNWSGLDLGANIKSIQKINY